MILLNVADDVVKMLNSLCPATVDPYRDLELFRELLTSNTATWIFQHPSFVQWQSSLDSFLWIYGKSTSDFCKY
jgi:hypothetical protein